MSSLPTKFKLLLFVLAFLFFNSCSNNKCVEGKGYVISSEIAVSDFTKLELKGNMIVKIAQNDISKVVITADELQQQFIKTKNAGKTLKIEIEREVCKGQRPEIFVSAKTWNELNLAGAIELSNENTINSENLNLNLKGNTLVKLHLSLAKLETNISGISELNINGQASSHFINLEGSGKINALDFVVSDYKIDCSGKGQFNINSLTTLNIKSKGFCEVNYKGNPKAIKNNKSGNAILKSVN